MRSKVAEEKRLKVIEEKTFLPSTPEVTESGVSQSLHLEIPPLYSEVARLQGFEACRKAKELITLFLCRRKPVLPTGLFISGP